MPDLTLQTIPFILVLLVPGFLWARVHAFLQTSKREADSLWMESLTLSAINLALWSWRLPNLWLETLKGVETQGTVSGGLMGWWTGVTLVGPALLGVLTGYVHRRNWIRKLLLLTFTLNIPHPAETAWDTVFSDVLQRHKLLWATVTLTDGSVVEGYFAMDSHASSRPGERDLYLEREYRLGQDGKLKLVEGSAGVWVSAAAIKAVEFKSVRLKKGKNNA